MAQTAIIFGSRTTFDSNKSQCKVILMMNIVTSGFMWQIKPDVLNAGYSWADRKHQQPYSLSNDHLNEFRKIKGLLAAKMIDSGCISDNK